MNIQELILELKKILTYSPNDGVFKWIDGSVAGKEGSRGYWVLRVNGKQYQAHRLAWLYVYGEIPNGMIDHINRVKTDNRICNLRVVTNTENQLNKISVRTSTGYTGVRLDKTGKYAATYTEKGNKVYVGWFKSAVEANIARVTALKTVDRYRNYDPYIITCIEHNLFA